MQKINLTIHPEKRMHDISEKLFGLFLEDINFACDGGLNANLVNNHSFDGIYLPANSSEAKSFISKSKPKTVSEPLRYWMVEGKVTPKKDEALCKNSNYIEIDGNAVLKNRGYNGGRTQKNACAMSVKSGHIYEFSCFVKNIDFNGNVSMYIENAGKQKLTGIGKIDPEGNWRKYTAELDSMKTDYGCLVIDINGSGRLQLDCVSFLDTDCWGKDDPKWSQGKLRRDMVEVLKELNPKFMRFPGGCIVEGLCEGNEYNWKDTVGPLENRKANFNLWGLRQKDGGCGQSYQTGFYEYFLLCEDLRMEPLPIIWAGMNCQMRSRHKVPAGTEEFESKVVRMALDLIDYANGDPGNNKWAELRAEAGHPEPFNLKMIGIGNENFGKDYLSVFETVKKAIDEYHPGITCVLSTGPFLGSKNFRLAWARAREKFGDALIDEHFYKSGNWCLAHAGMYDGYDRSGPKVFLGEYAANDMFLPHKANTHFSAIAEAAFLTGVERNSDIVTLTSYAPLLSLVDGSQWKHNLINFNPGTVMKTPNYFVQQLYANNTGKYTLKTDGNLPEKVFLTASGDDFRVIVKIVNASPNASDAALKFEGIKNAEAKIQYLQWDNPNGQNTLNFIGEANYKIKPENAQMKITDGILNIKLPKYSFFVIVVKKP